MKKRNDKDRHSYIFTRETLGMTLLLFCALMLLILLTYNTVFSSLGAAICAFMYGTFGYACYLVVAAAACLGVWLVFGKKPAVRLRTALVVGLTATMFFMLFHAVTTRGFALDGYGSYLAQCYSSAERGYAGYTFGGAVSGLLVYPVARGTTFIGAYVIFSVALLLCGYLTFIVVRNDFIAHAGSRRVRAPRMDSEAAAEREPAPVPDPMPVADDSAFAVGDNYEIVNNFHPVQQQPESKPVQSVRDYILSRPDYSQQQPQSGGVSDDDEDKFSQKNLGRRILFENGEFAAESYRRNMIFNDDSYFNHPVHNDDDYLSSFSSGKKPANRQREQATQVYPDSYSQSYSREVESREDRPSAPAYIYGDKPAQTLDDYVPQSPSYDEPVYDGPSFDADDEDFVRGCDEPGYAESEADDVEEPAGRETEAQGGDGADYGDSYVSGGALPADEVGLGYRRGSDDYSGLPGAENEDADNAADDDVLGGTDVSTGADEDEHLPLRRTEFPADGGRESRSNDLRSIFSSSNSNSSDDIRPDEARISSRRDSGRENLFDGDGDDYLGEDEPDLGTRGLRPAESENFSSARRSEEPQQPFGRDRMSSAPLRAERETGTPLVGRRAPEEEKPAPEPEKPKHVWKKYVRPTLDLLADYPENNNANLGEIEDNKRLIIETLENFRIAAHISDVTVGPAITRYDVIIEDRTNIKSAMRYREAIAMALMKENVTAYLNYSKGAISIEVPNGKRTVVGLKTMLTSSEFINCKPNTLTFALGKNVEGRPNCPDITKMPHLLVAGTTGSGKSICLSSLIISLLYKYGPDELRFILVDPKQSEFISYENLPHLIVNEIISDVDKAIKALNWAIKEMERRYTLFKEMTLAGTLVKNLNEYNAHLPEGEEKLPKIVIILDEFGDLMLQNKKDIESRIIRLVQKSRAAGIHLILATQRPSVDCITGLIKSNLPTRIGFKVNSFDDSRTIFDVGGAEKLLGAGDMYFRSASNPDLARIQGCFIDSPEVQAVTDFVKKNNETYFDQSVSDFINTVEEPEGGDAGDSSDGEGDVKIDDKFIQALKFCVTSNQASVSMLQRRFPIGYVKACKIIDWMENMNYITQSEGSKPRKVLLSLDEFTRIYGDVDD